MDLNEIQSLIKFVAKSGATEVELETKDFKITIKTPAKKRRGQPDDTTEETVIQAQIPVVGTLPTSVEKQAETETPVTKEESTAADSEKDSIHVTVKSPMIGTFYRAVAPDKPSFVSVDDIIEPGKVICIIEAMKLFNEIEAEISGRIVKVLVDDATPVEYDQPLFLVDPA